MRKGKLLALPPILVLILAACGSQQPAQPTMSVSDIQTLAVAAFAAGLTQTAQAMPTDTPTDTPAPTNTTVAFNTFVPIGSAGASSPTASCNGLLYIKDVTIPDNTQMEPGKKFTKTWLVQNTGGCPWQIGFKFTLIGGDPMGGSTLVLSQAVSPGNQYQISVPMTAPTQSGKASGTWKMADAGGTFFGDPLTVVIVVTNAGTETPGATDTPSPTP
jgi:uncharacterized protein affecting Mg2+/Co2+ transport